MDGVNNEIQNDMLIDVRITWGDIMTALLGWLGEFATAPFRALNPQATPEPLHIEAR